jgi:Family of unknown function (DUF5631)/Family of unknown function (DUF5632)
VGADLPKGTWTAPLVGPWWPGPSTTLRDAAQHWATWSTQKQEIAQTLRHQRELLSQNQGKTAEDLISRYFQGEKSELDKAEKYKIKADALNSAADEIDYLRSRLTEIANQGNKEIDDVLASKKPLPEQLAEIQAIQARCNADAAKASGAAVNKIMAATQKILDAEGIHGDVRSWAREHGFNTDDVPPPGPISKEDLDSPVPGSSARGGPGSVQGSGAIEAPPQMPGGSPRGGGAVPAGPPAAPPQVPGGSAWGGSGGPVPAGSPAAMPAGSPSVPGVGGPTAPAISATPGAPLSPAALGQGFSPGPMGQSVLTGMTTGQPATAGLQSLSDGAMHAMEPGSAALPQAPPALATSPAISAPALSGGESFTAAHVPVDTPSVAPGAAATPTGGDGVPVTPAVMTGGPASAPAAPAIAGPALPTGPLPAYGSDLRPPVVAAPAVPTVPSAPVSGAPVAPSASTSPSAGGPLVSPVERAASVAAAGKAGASGSSMAGSSALSATTGAAAGTAAGRAAEQQRLQRLVDAVARQEPRLSWAAGLRDDGTTNLVTDLAGGWIPPHVRLPANVTLLEPTSRRRDAVVVDLLGAVVVAAAHEPNAYIEEPGSDPPALTGGRTARSAAPNVDELGPTLVEAVRRRDGLPRIAQAVAAPATRNTGVAQNEAELLRGSVADIQSSVLSAYPHHDQTAVGDWMLLAAIEALIDGHEYLANYHMAWFSVINRRAGSQEVVT